MRVFALSDVHVDYAANAKWIADLSLADYRDDVLILAGDVSDILMVLGWCLRTLTARFSKVLFVPGNHDLWVVRDEGHKTSLDKFQEVAAVVHSSGASMQAFRSRGVAIMPLLGWYDYSFGEPTQELKSMWMDYHACRWPVGFGERQIAAHFALMNGGHAGVSGEKTITFSHFLPRIDVMPSFIPREKRLLYPVLGSALLEGQLRALNSSVHIYGHSHVNRSIDIDGVSYINNALGYPTETRIAARSLSCIHEC